MNDFAGRWCTTYGRMDLEQSGTHVKGVYQALEGIPCQIEGQVQGDVFKFHYREPKGRGTGSFQLQRYGMFSGQWREDKTGNGGVWHGYRGFDGVWDTTFGLLRLIQEPDRVVGIYESEDGGASLEGELRNAETPAKPSPASRSKTPADAAQETTGTTQGVASRLVFRYQEPTSQGEGWFELDESQWRFHGKWRAAGARSWEPWGGQRVFPTANLKWLVVLEAHWQRVLQEENYSLGGMLREFFARVPGLEVRHRFFASEADLESWCREILYVPEPVVLVVATHGTPEGLCGHRGILRPDALTKNLRYANNVDVLHFSACYLGNGSDGGFARTLCRELPFPISGYAAYADWVASVLVDFTYLDMILEHGLTPEKAADQVKQLLPFAGDRTSRQCPYPATCFRFWPAGGGRRPSAKTTPSIPRADENAVRKPATGTPKKTAASSPARTGTGQQAKQRDGQSSAASSRVRPVPAGAGNRGLPEPRSAWIVHGSDESFQTVDDLEKFGGSGEWTATKNVEIGDTLFFYFIAPYTAIQFVARASSKPWYDESWRQWYVAYESMVAVEPITKADICTMFGEKRFLPYFSGAKYLRPDFANRLLERAKVAFCPFDSAGEIALQRVAGRKELGDPKTISLDDLRRLDSAAFLYEEDVECYFVEPLLRLADVDKQACIQRKYDLPKRKTADYAALDSKRKALCIIEVKLELREKKEWKDSSEFRQARKYAKACKDPAFVLIDRDRVFCFRTVDEVPCLTLDRSSLDSDGLRALRAHILGQGQASAISRPRR